MSKPRIYFPNLSGLRFIAAFLVIIHHIEQFKFMFGLPNFWTNPFILIIGKLGVVLFFVLSGFLITFLLLTEEHTYSIINIKNFYVRRVLRIWPLYFLIIALALFVLPNIDIFSLQGYGKERIYTYLFLKLGLYIFFLPNLVLAMFGIIPYAAHTWSIGTEEQFYLIWPIILNKIKKNRLLLMILIILLCVVFSVSLEIGYFNEFRYHAILKSFWSAFKIDSMIIGGICAYLLFKKSKLLAILNSLLLFYPTVLVVVIFIMRGVQIPYVHFEVYSLLFGIIILNLASNDKLKNILENGLFHYLGNISYGLYMYHPIAIVLGLTISMFFQIKTNWIIYPICTLITIIIAGLSYQYFEKYFLRYKNRFSRVVSGVKL